MMIRGGYFAKNKNAGQPDIFGMLKNGSGRLFGIEVKTEIGRLSDEQRRELKELEDAGALIIIARDLDTVRTILATGEANNGNHANFDQ